MTFFTSDHHFGHANILEYCGRPYDNVQDMNEDLVDRWNSRIKPSDSVYVIGDLCLGKLSRSLEYVKYLNGVITLIIGNHDKPFKTLGDKRERCIQIYLDAGVQSVIDGPINIFIDKYNVTLCHFPYKGDSQEGDRFSEYRPKGNNILLHGHTHGKWRTNKRMIDIGVDSWGGFPVSKDEIIKLIKEDNWDLPPLIWREKKYYV